MKKLIMAIAMVSALIGCKKGEITTQKFEETLNTIDSTSSAVQNHIENVQAEAVSTLDSAQIKIKDIKAVNK